MVEIVKDIKEAKYITHSGTMHADEVFATAFLELYRGNIKLFRTPEINIKEFSDDILIYDIGRGKFDHHQEDRKLRDNNIPYCSLGLLWQEFGRDFLKQRNTQNIEDVFIGIDKELIEGIDAIDNGIFPKIESNFKVRTTSDIIKLFNPAFNSNENEEEQFLKAVNIAKIIFEEEILYISGKVLAKKLVENKIDESIKKHYLVLDEYMPYEETIFAKDPGKEIYYVIYPSNRGGYAAQTVYNSSEDKTARLPFPEEWAGLDTKLKDITKVDDATFCHLGRFLVCAKTKESIIKLVELSLKQIEEVEHE